MLFKFYTNLVSCEPVNESHVLGALLGGLDADRAPALAEQMHLLQNKTKIIQV
jgi:hypothetical protein